MKKVIAIFGMPRSGTSFIGQILDSSPDVSFRMEPIFSYKLKNIVDENSAKEEYINFFDKAFDSNEDVFMNQFEQRKKGIYPIFAKKDPDMLVFKMTRFHQIIPTLLKHFDSSFLKIVVVVRNPCGAINSWLSHPNEFPQHCDKFKEWKTGNCRKTAKEEFWGFNDWKEVTLMHMEMEKKYKNLKIFRYEDAVKDIDSFTKKLFEFTDLKKTKQTDEFIGKCQNRNDADPYSVFKNKSVAIKWKKDLDKAILEEIYKDLKGTKLETFLID